MNLLVTGNFSKNIIDLLKKSKYSDKIYTAGNASVEGLSNIVYKNFDELIRKSIDVKIDIAVNTDNDLIEKGIVEAFNSSRINLISVNKKWLNLENSRLSAKKLLEHYKINTPKTLQIPSKFPLMIKTDSPEGEYIVSSMEELLEIMEVLKNKKTFLEELTEGEKFKIFAIWDKKNIKYFCPEETLTEVQKDRLELLETKLNFMFSDEKADFIGFFTINSVWYKNDWYVEGFEAGVVPENIFEPKNEASADKDFVYILDSALYQKLG